MTIIVNHSKIEIDAPASIADMLSRNDMAGDGIAVARGGKVIPRDKWDSTFLSDNDEITVIRAVCGG